MARRLAKKIDGFVCLRCGLHIPSVDYYPLGGGRYTCSNCASSFGLLNGRKESGRPCLTAGDRRTNKWQTLLK